MLATEIGRPRFLSGIQGPGHLTLDDGQERLVAVLAAWVGGKFSYIPQALGSGLPRTPRARASAV